VQGAQRIRGAVVAAALALVAACRTPGPEEPVRAGDAERAGESVAGARRARAHYDDALRRTKPDDLAGQAAIHEKLYQALTLSGDTEEARRELERAAELFGRAGDADRALVARARLAAGEEQVETLKSIAGDARARGLDRALAHATAHLGDALFAVQRAPEALTTYEEALRLAQALGDAALEAQVEHGLGNVYYMRGDGQRALVKFHRVLALARQIPRPGLAADTVSDIGLTHLWLMENELSALPYIQAGIAAEVALGQYKAAMGPRLALAVLVGRKDERAGIAAHESALAEARRLGDDEHVGEILTHLGEKYRHRELYAQARAAFEEAAALGEKRGFVHVQRLALIGMARLAMKERRWADAETAARRFVDEIAAAEAKLPDEQLRMAYAGATRAGLELLLAVALERSDRNRAFATSEEMRARQLLAALTSHPDSRADILDAAGAQGILDGETTLVEYAYLPNRGLVAFVLDRDQVVSLPLTPGETAARIDAWYTLISGPRPPGTEELQPILRDIAAAVLTPIVPHLRGQRLVIVADKNLQRVPFAALPLPNGEPLLARFELVYAPSASVLAAARRMRSGRPQPERTVAVLADPVYARTDSRLSGSGPPPPATALASAAVRAAQGSGLKDIVRLPATRVEAKAITELVPPADVFVALDAAASRAAAIGPEVASARIVHFATHGVSNHERSWESGLILSLVDAAGEPVEGFLSLPAIEELHLAADLVVLSACWTADGFSYLGEGISSLTRAFLRGGVPRVVASLWQVDDAAGAALMKRFYAKMLRDGLAPAAALREAQLELRADPRFASPRLWAAFSLHGDWR